MSYRVYQALFDHFESAGLFSSFDEFYFGRAADFATYPYVVMTSLGNTPSVWTSGSEFRRQDIQLSIFLKHDNTNDPVLQLGSLMNTLDASVHFNTISLQGSGSGYVIEIRRMRDELFIDDIESRIWQGQLDYKITRRKAA